MGRRPHVQRYMEGMVIKHVRTKHAYAHLRAPPRVLRSGKNAMSYTTMSGTTPRTSDQKTKAAATVLSAQLEQCWQADIDWKVVPSSLKEVSNHKFAACVNYSINNKGG